jgi:hypothetical protein
MLARYKSVDWRNLLNADDSTRPIIEEIINVCMTKIPILATEVLFRKRILGSMRKIPNDRFE